MAAPTNTQRTAAVVGIREDLSNIIYRVAPEETPIYSSGRKVTASATRHEWQTETIADAAVNAQLEGDDVGTLGAAHQSVRISNLTQIFHKHGGVSGTAQAVNTAGRADELDKQKLMKGLEMKRDIELSMASSSASRVESGSNPRLSGGLSSWITTASDYGSGGSAGGFNTGTSIVDAPTAGTNRTFTETILKTVLQERFTASGKMSALTAYMSPSLKQTASTFTGIADIRQASNGDMATIIGAADVYVSDFGKVAMVAHAYATPNRCLLLDPKMYGWATLRGIKEKKLSDTGDSDKFLLVTEGTTVCHNEKAHGVILALS